MKMEYGYATSPLSLGSAPQGPADLDRSKMNTLLGELESRIATAASLGSRLHEAMDYVTGPQPSPSNATGQVSATPVGIIPTAHERLQTLYVFLDRIDDEVRRLERVIG